MNHPSTRSAIILLITIVGLSSVSSQNCGISMNIVVQEDVPPLGLCEDFYRVVSGHFRSAAYACWQDNRKYLGISRVNIFVPSWWEFTCYGIRTGNPTENAVLITRGDMQSWIRDPKKCGQTRRGAEFILPYHYLFRTDIHLGRFLFNLLSRWYEYYFYHRPTNPSWNVCSDRVNYDIEVILKDKLRLPQCPMVIPEVNFYAFQNYNAAAVSLVVEKGRATDRDAYRVILKPKFQNLRLENVYVTAEVKLGTKTQVVRAYGTEDDQFVMIVENYFGPGTYRVTFFVNGLNSSRGYPLTPPSASLTAECCHENYREPKFTHVGAFKWRDPQIRDFKFPVIAPTKPTTTPVTTKEPSSAIDPPSGQPPSDSQAHSDIQAPSNNQAPSDVQYPTYDQEPDYQVPSDSQAPSGGKTPSSGKVPSSGKAPSGSRTSVGKLRFTSTRRPTTEPPKKDEPVNYMQIVYIVVPIVGLVILFGVGYYCCNGKKRPKAKGKGKSTKKDNGKKTKENDSEEDDEDDDDDDD